MKTVTTFTFLFLAVSYASAAQTVTIDTVPVGNAGNEPDELTVQSSNKNNLRFGGVNYNYRIGKTEVTNAQYVEFLNAVAASDPYELYNDNMASFNSGGITRSGSSGSYTYSVKPDSIGNGPGGADGNDYSYGSKPVNWVSWYDAIRFANWLHNGQGSGDTETGAYTLLGGTPTPSNERSITRNPGATWVLPNENEWYKAAYHKNDGVTGNYWEYPSSHDTVPNNNLPSADTGNLANWDSTIDLVGYRLTDVGAYTLSKSPYGTFDQGGNVEEWNESFQILPDPNDPHSNFSRGMRGGHWYTFPVHDYLAASKRHSVMSPNLSRNSHGFRVALIPEPSSLLLGALAAVGALLRRKSR